jgi:hypothetical protein
LYLTGGNYEISDKMAAHLARRKEFDCPPEHIEQVFATIRKTIYERTASKSFEAVKIDDYRKRKTGEGS